MVMMIRDMEKKEEGRVEGILDTLASLVADGILTISDAAKRANLTPDEFQARLTEVK